MGGVDSLIQRGITKGFVRNKQFVIYIIFVNDFQIMICFVNDFQIMI